LEIFFVLGIFLVWIVDVPKALNEKRQFDLQHNTYFLNQADDTIREVSITPLFVNAKSQNIMTLSRFSFMKSDNFFRCKGDRRRRRKIPPYKS
jgi:hypothetical protein